MNLLLHGRHGSRGRAPRQVIERPSELVALTGHVDRGRQGKVGAAEMPSVLCVRVSVAAQMIGIGRTKLYDLIGSGQLETFKIGSATLVTTDSIRALIERSV